MAKPNETYTKEVQERIDAVNRYQRGERTSKICTCLGRSRSWLQKWVGRYIGLNKSSEKEWFKEESRAPKNVHRKTDLEIEELVVNVRKSLMEGKKEDTKYRYIGAVEIQFQMHELVYSEDETPSLSTIKRIIKSHRLAVACEHKRLPQSVHRPGQPPAVYQFAFANVDLVLELYQPLAVAPQLIVDDVTIIYHQTRRCVVQNAIGVRVCPK
ncbi:MAG: helix-turn-helix domain-containing protein [Bacteroidales bacterium]|nr:helix-turn-helix domain-containing protein [Bacteroidales bacterium]